jgi:hypothetical protein
VTANPCWSRSSIYLTITSSSSCVSFFELGWLLCWTDFLVRQFCSVDSTTLYVAVAWLTAGIYEVWIAEIASRISALFEGVLEIGG